jgi:hypothetical protein
VALTDRGTCSYCGGRVVGGRVENKRVQHLVIGDQRSGDGLAGGAVVPDRGGQGKQALGDAGPDAVDAAAAVQFEVELAFEDVVDRLDELADRFE